MLWSFWNKASEWASGRNQAASSHDTSSKDTSSDDENSDDETSDHSTSAASSHTHSPDSSNLFNQVKQQIEQSSKQFDQQKLP